MKDKIVLYELESECCGCSACEAICPQDAIKMSENSEGFLYPKIDENKCIECKLCLKVCPLKYEERAEDTKFKVGILCLSHKNNFGAKLVAWALQEKVKMLLPKNAEVGIIEYEGQEERHFLEDFSLNPAEFVKSGRRFLNEREKAKAERVFMAEISQEDKNKKAERFNDFDKNYLNIIGKTRRTLEFKAVAKTLDAVIIGSDIVFRPEFAEKFFDVYLLGCLKNTEGIKRISYAASIANKDTGLLDSLKENYKKGMENFDSVSVREKSAKNFLEELTDKKISYCCDPVLFYGENDFEFIPKTEDGEYIYVNLLDKIDNAKAVVANIKSETGLRVKYYSNYMLLDGESVFSDGPLEFIDRIRGANYVITNSFHSVIFSILFHKKFFVLTRARQGAKLFDLLYFLGLDDRIVKNGKIDLKKEIDWVRVDKIIEKWRKDSMDFLKEALDIKNGTE